MCDLSVKQPVKSFLSLRIHMCLEICALVALVACTGEATSWTLDEMFSYELLSVGLRDQLLGEVKDPSEEVDEVEIFCSEDDWPPYTTVEGVREEKIVFSSRDAATIRDLIHALGAGREEMSCLPPEASFVVRVLALEERQKRAGYFIYWECPEKSAGTIMPFGSSSIGSAPELRRFLRSHGITCGELK